MSTNYYWHVDGGTCRTVTLPTGEETTIAPDHHNPLWHVCKTSSRLTWAQDSGLVIEVCQKYLDAPVIENEYREVLTGRQFLELVNLYERKDHRYDLIGEWFS